MSDANTDTASWETARKKRSFKQFIALQCVKDSTKELNAYANNFDITQLDVTKMKAHILDCVAALGIVQQELVSADQPSIDKEEEEASNKVFKASLLTMATAMIHDGTGPPKQGSSVDMLLRAFPDESKQTDGRSWLPLHWAVVTDEKCVTEEDVKVIYISDPMALQRYQSDGIVFHAYTPAHVLCMQEMTNRNMSLVQYFSVCNSGAFTMSARTRSVFSPSGFSALPAACCYGQPTEELLKHLLQLDSSQTNKMSGKDGLTPLGYLCKNSNCSDRLIGCLLEVDSSAEVVASGIAGCLASTDYSCVLERVEMLLKANPDVVNYRIPGGQNLLHIAAYESKLSPQLCIAFMQRILAIHKDAVREVTLHGSLPVHYAARYCAVEVMEFLLGLYPESALVIAPDGTQNLLRLAVNDTQSTTSVMEAKVKFLCSRYPAMILQRDGVGATPLHSAICCKNIPAVQILCEAGEQEQVRLPVAYRMVINKPRNGWLPLHFLVIALAESLRNSLLSKAADCFRMFLRWYPEAAGIEGGIDREDEDDNDDNNNNYKKTPYQLAVDKNLSPYYLRLLLRAAPDLNPAELHRLNYAERRMAMFLAFKAVTLQKKPVVLKRLCFENKDLVKHVVSFL